MFTKKSFRVMKILPNVVRLCHSGSADQFNSQKLHKIKTFDKTVDPFSKICIETPMHVKIKPIDLLQYPNGDRLILSLYSKKEDSSLEFSIKQTLKRVDVVAKTKGYPSTNAVCVIQAPIRASFDIQGTGVSSISIEQMHSDECSLKTVSGSVILKDVRGKSLQVRSEKGHVCCEGTLEAEKIDIRTDSTAEVVCKHIRSNLFKVSTSAGNIKTESCYSDESYFSTVIGSLRLANMHSSCLVEVLQRGDLTMTGLNGTLNAIIKSGDIHIQASKLQDKNSIFVHESGLVDIQIPESFAEMCLIEFIASKLNMEEKIMKMGQMVEDPLHQRFKYGPDNTDNCSNELYVDCRNGSVEVKVSSWQKMLEEKGLKFHNSKE